MSEGSHRSSAAGAASAGIAVVTPHAVALLPAGAPARIVEDLWRALADPAVTAEAIVAALPLRGPDEIASFAVLVHEGGGPDGVRLQVVLRGDAVVDVDVDGDADPRRVDARGTQPFYLATLDRVRAYRAGRGDAAGIPTAGGLPLTAGAVAADAVQWRRDVRGAGAGTADAGRDGVPSSAQVAAAPPGDPGLVATVLEGPADAVAPTADPDAAHAAPDADVSRARSAGVATVAMPTVPEADAEAPLIVHAVRIVREGMPHVVDADADAADPHRIPLDAPVIIGRRPRPPRVVRGVAPRLVAVPSPLGEISGTHVAVRQDSGVIVVTDLDSTNGTVVLAPGAERLALRPGESLVVVPGTLVDIGDGVVLEILSAR